MIEENATVVTVEPGFVWVETQRRSSCSTCASAANCGTSILSRLFPPTRNRLRVPDPIGLETGERVIIGVADATLIRAALMAYLLPLVTLIAGAGLASVYQIGEGLVALAGIVGLAMGLWLARRLTGGTRGQERYRPTLVRREAPTNQFPLTGLTHGVSDQDPKGLIA